MEKLAKNRNCIWKLIMLVFTIIILSSPIFATWWNDSLDYRKQINITNVGNEQQTDFPIYLNISYEIGMQTDFDDIRFVSKSCGNTSPTVLDYEIEHTNSNRAIVWVKIPTLNPTTTHICMYYGNSTTGSQESPTDVWKSNYGIVYHMDSAGNDSTTNNRDRVANVGAPTVDNTGLGYGLNFSLGNAWSQADLAYWEIEWTQRTHEVLLTTSSDITSRQTLLAEGGGVNGVLMYILNGQIYSRWWSESAPNWGGNHFNTSINENTTYHVVMQLTENGDYGLYLNGELITNESTPDHIDAHSGNGGIGYTNQNKDFHDGSFSGQYFTGRIEEFRVYDAKENDAWVNMSAKNMINHSETVSYNAQEVKPDILTATITSPSVATIYSILSNETLELNVTINCRSNSNGCGNITTNSEYNSTPSIFSVISTFSGTTPMWTSSTQARSCVLNGYSSCDLSWIINVTDPPANIYRIRATSTSNLSFIPSNSSEELTIEIIDGAAIVFNQTTLNMGPVFKNSGDINNNISVFASVQNNTGINVTCDSGDCGVITQNWNDGTNLTEGNSQQFTFTCSDNNFGIFNATYSVVSNEDIVPSTIFVECTINQVFGPIAISLITPLEDTTIEVGQNRTFTLQANVSCNGTCGNITAYAVYTQNYGDGSDGSLTVTSANTIVNNYTYLSANELAGETTLSVNSETNFSAGDEILIIQMQSGVGIGSAGNYEFATVDSTAAGTITIKTPTKNAYGSGTHDSLLSSATQIVRVPHYTDVTINSGASISAPAWNGYTGGIVVFRAQGTLNTTGYINVSEKGFRGGDCNGCGDNAFGDQGEGTTGIGNSLQSANGIGGGGGYGPTGLGGEPGAGGGHATAGGNGVGQHTTDATGGGTIGQANLSTIFFGGGAGGGGDNDNLAPNAEFVDGGGIAILFAKTIINARVHAIGEAGIISQNNGGTTGAGAGGSIWLSGDDVELTDVNASGSPTVLGFGSDFGGAGGDGRIRLDYSNLTGTNSDPIQGHNGSATDRFRVISTTSGETPLWTTSSQPQNCIIAEDGNCIFTWTINATGPINSSVNISVIAFSNYSQIESKNTNEVNVTIVDQVVPTITLTNPLNNTKIIGNGTINFTWSINDDNENLSCSFYLNGNLNQTVNCTNVGNNSLILTLEPGYYNWSISATDSQNLSADSGTFYFTLIKNYSIRISKSISSISNNQYLINTTINNYVSNSTYNINYIDLIPSNFTLGSETPAFSFFNIINGPNYFGRIYVWNINTSIQEVTYSLSGQNDYYLKKAFIVALE